MAVIGAVDRRLLAQIRERAASVVEGAPDSECDLIIFSAEVPADLLRLAALRRRLVANGAVWVATPRGRRDLQDVHVIDAARRAELVDNKVVRFSDTHTALRLVIPRAKR